MEKENNIYDSLSYKIVMSVTEEYARIYDVDTEGTDSSYEIITEEQARNVIANCDEGKALQYENSDGNNSGGGYKVIIIMIIIAIVAVVGFMLFASKKNEMRHQDDSTEIVDSVGDVSEIPTENTEKEESAVSETPDLLSFVIKGVCISP